MASTLNQEVVRASQESDASRSHQRFQESSNFETDGADDPSEILDVDEQVTMDGLVAGQHQPEMALENAHAKRRELFREPSAGEAFLLDRPSTNFDSNDPIKDAPDQVWYFRSRQIGERGPLKGEQMQRCLNSGEVTVGSMVWRGDWDDWIAAEKVFGNLADQAKREKQQDRLAKAIEATGYEMPESKPVRKPLFFRTKRSKIFVAISVAGLLVVALLVFVLIRILSN